MVKKIVYLILFLGINTVFYGIKGSPPNNSNLMQEKIITGDLIKRCLEKIRDLDRYYWYYFAAEIAQELSANPWLLDNTCKNCITITEEREKALSQLLKDLQLIAESPIGPHPRKQNFADVAKAIYERHYSRCRKEEGGYYNYNLFLQSI